MVHISLDGGQTTLCEQKGEKPDVGYSIMVAFDPNWISIERATSEVRCFSQVSKLDSCCTCIGELPKLTHTLH